MHWPTDTDRHDGYQILRVIYKRAGMKAKEAAAAAEVARLDKVLADSPPATTGGSGVSGH